jgi:glycosyltransferase involved in cell wall biosynthesis
VPEPAHIALFGPSLAGGGAERFLLTLGTALAADGTRVDLVVTSATGALADSVPDTVRLIDLGARRMLRAVPPLVRYLRRERPAAMLAVAAPTNCIAILARALARVPVRLIVSERNAPAHAGAAFGGWRGRLLPLLMRASYPRADAILAVSTDVADALARCVRVPRACVEVVPNPVVTEAKLEASRQPPAHPWFASTAAPVILGAGRLVPQKNFALLIRAFARVRSERVVRLTILGEGPERADLLALARKLRIAEDVALPGFVANPWSCMRRAAAFVLPSRWEGLPAVLIEALACGAPVIAADCPGGSAEILEGGRWGTLTPVGDVDALAAAIGAVLDAPRGSPGTAHAAAATVAVARFRDAPVIARYRALLEDRSAAGNDCLPLLTSAARGRYPH